MRSSIMALAAAGTLSLVGLGAEAMPAQVPPGASAPSSQLTLVAEGCGRGLERGPAGGCRPIGRAVVVERPAVVVRRPARPCGVQIGPVGVRTPC